MIGLVVRDDRETGTDVVVVCIEVSLKTSLYRVIISATCSWYEFFTPDDCRVDRGNDTASVAVSANTTVGTFGGPFCCFVRDIFFVT